MRRVSPGILLTFCAASMVGCSDRPLRPLNPCTTSGASGSVPIADLKNVDLVFLVDNSGSMAEEQRKLQAEFPTMINALITGDLDGDAILEPNEGPPVSSLRVAVITSDMGVRGMTATTITGCNSTPTHANYGNDGVFRRDLTPDGAGACIASPVAVADLPTFLTFNDDPAWDMTQRAQAIDGFTDKVSCLTSVGTHGCAYEQQLESMLKAITPSTYVPASGDPAVPDGFFDDNAGDGVDHSIGHGDDAATNGGWFRSDSLLALVVVTDEDDCSARNPEVFNYQFAAAPYDDGVTGIGSASPAAARIARTQTRCGRFENDLLYPVTRYIDGFLSRRASAPGAFVFAAITGVPPDLTDGATAGNDGTSNLDAILADSRMAYNYITNSAGVTAVDYVPACSLLSSTLGTTATGDVTSGSNMITNVVPNFIAQTSFTAHVDTNQTNAKDDFTITVAAWGNVPAPGMTFTGPAITGTKLITRVRTTGVINQYLISISDPVTLTTSDTITVGAQFGPAREGDISGAGIPTGATTIAISGSNPYSITLNDTVATASGTGVALNFGVREVSARPARRITRVAQGIVAAGSNATVQSICAQTFGPAMGRILALIQANLRGSCLPRPLIRNAANEVSCDVFVTLPPGVACDDPSLNGAYDPTPDETFTETNQVSCRMSQIPVSVADRGTGIAPVGVHGWFYDDYTSEIGACPEEVRISFTSGDTPPQGSRLNFSCAQPVQDGDLAVDINSPCTGADTHTPCPFPTEADGREFALRYNLTSARNNFDPATDLVCEFDSNTCQIACGSDAECPGGFVCYNDPNDQEDAQGSTASYCVNPTCGTSN